jgi:hypothetical protein
MFFVIVTPGIKNPFVPPLTHGNHPGIGGLVTVPYNSVPVTVKLSGAGAAIVFCDPVTGITIPVAVTSRLVPGAALKLNITKLVYGDGVSIANGVPEILVRVTELQLTDTFAGDIAKPAGEIEVGNVAVRFCTLGEVTPERLRTIL